MYSKVLVTLLLCVCDVCLSVILFGHGAELLYYLRLALHGLSLASVPIDLVVLAVVRACILCGAAIAKLFNPTVAGERIYASRHVVTLLCTAMWVWTMIRLLLYSEFSDLRTKHLWWDMTLIIWSLMAQFFTYLIYNVLLAQKPPPDSSKEEETEPKEKPSRAVLRLLKLSLPDWKYNLAAFIFLLISCAAEIFIPLYTGDVIQAIAIDQSHKNFKSAIIYMGVFSLISALASGMRAWFFKIAMSRLNIRIRLHLFQSVVKQEIAFFDKTNTGDISSRLQSDTSVMSSALGLNTNIFLRSLIKIFGDVFFMVKLSWRLTIITFIGLPLLTAFSKIYGSFYEKLSTKVQDSFAEANQVSEEACSCMRTVRSFAAEEKEYLRYKTKMDKVFKLNLTEAASYAVYMWGNSFFSLSLSICTLYYGGHLVSHSLMTGGNLVSFVLYQSELSNNIQSIGYVYTGLMQAVGASKKVFEYIDRKSKMPCNIGKLAPSTLEGRLEFRDVWFSYPSHPDKMVLKGVSFVVKPGEVVALVGPSGGGKSSCINLLEHFYRPQEGQILLDNVDIQLYDHHYLHYKVSLVSQEPVLFAGSVKDNIVYGLDHWDMQQVEQAARLANAYDFIHELPDGFETNVGEKGSQLSGGQKQRVAIARALIRKPTVLLLDEATSALDSESEYVVQQALYSNLANKTVVIIAHRLSTVEHADRVLVISQGQIVEQGTHAQLLANNQLYYSLVQRQLLRTEPSPPRQQVVSTGTQVRESIRMLSPLSASV